MWKVSGNRYICEIGLSLFTIIIGVSLVICYDMYDQIAIVIVVVLIVIGIAVFGINILIVVIVIDPTHTYVQGMRPLFSAVSTSCCLSNGCRTWK